MNRTTRTVRTHYLHAGSLESLGREVDELVRRSYETGARLLSVDIDSEVTVIRGLVGNELNISIRYVADVSLEVQDG